MLVDRVKVDNAFAETLPPDGSKRLFHGHVCLQQRLIDASMSRDRVVEIRQRKRIGHAFALHRVIVNANGSRKPEIRSQRSEGRPIQDAYIKRNWRGAASVSELITRNAVAGGGLIVNNDQCIPGVLAPVFTPKLD